MDSSHNKRTLAIPLACAGFCQLVALFVALGTLDGGRLLIVSPAWWAGFWCATVIVLVRRDNHATLAECYFILLGFIPLGWVMPFATIEVYDFIVG